MAALPPIQHAGTYSDYQDANYYSTNTNNQNTALSAPIPQHQTSNSPFIGQTYNNNSTYNTGLHTPSPEHGTFHKRQDSVQQEWPSRVTGPQTPYTTFTSSPTGANAGQQMSQTQLQAQQSHYNLHSPPTDMQQNMQQQQQQQQMISSNYSQSHSRHASLSQPQSVQHTPSHTPAHDNYAPINVNRTPYVGGHMSHSSISSVASAPSYYTHHGYHQPSFSTGTMGQYAHGLGLSNYGAYMNGVSSINQSMSAPTGSMPAPFVPRYHSTMPNLSAMPNPEVPTVSSSVASTDSVYDPTGQTAPPGVKPKVTATLWEDEGTLCFQVEARGICVARRDDSHMINGTKLLNVANMTRGRRDGLLKSEKLRHVVKIGPMHLKGVWIPFERALDFANKEKITDLLYPLFVHNINGLLYNPNNTSARPSISSASMPPPNMSGHGMGAGSQDFGLNTPITNSISNLSSVMPSLKRRRDDVSDYMTNTRTRPMYDGGMCRPMEEARPVMM